MQFKLPVLAVALTFVASALQAELIVINGRYVVSKDSIRGYFYRQSDERTVFDIRWSDWSTQYRCDDIYDRTKVEAAMLNLVLQIAETRSLDFQDFLDGEGLEGCEKF